MSRKPRELDPQTRAAETGRAIGHSLFCGRCGYDLRSLPYLGRCPECGQKYDANATKMEGIFRDEEVELPIGDGLGFLLFAVFTVCLIGSSLKPFASGRLFMGLITGVLMLVFAVRGYARLETFLSFHRVAKRIRRQKDD
jgi:hypothetical protein